MKEKIIISLGGSLIVPEEIDVEFIKKLRTVLGKFPDKQFIVAPGGGKIARKYGMALKDLGNENTDDSDWLGIYSIRLNCLLISLAFKKLKNVSVLQSLTAKPGQSSDSHAVEHAKKYKSKTIINLSNIDYVYDKNPNEHKDARPLKAVSWKDFLKIVDTKWEANQSWPFDPTASKIAQKLGIKVVFMNGVQLDNLEKYLNGGSFIGTVIS